MIIKLKLIIQHEFHLFIINYSIINLDYLLFISLLSNNLKIFYITLKQIL